MLQSTKAGVLVLILLWLLLQPLLQLLPRLISLRMVLCVGAVRLEHRPIVESCVGGLLHAAWGFAGKSDSKLSDSARSHPGCLAWSWQTSRMLHLEQHK